MIVAYHFSHNEGIEQGTIDAAGQTTGAQLVDMYEADGEIRTFDTKEQADAWLREQRDEDDDDEDWFDVDED